MATTTPENKRAAPLGVGFLGAGPVTQAIHLPTLARMPELFRTVLVMDADAVTAASVAARVGAESTTSSDALLADSRIDVVAICSPHAFHAEQVEAACRAGKAAVLCEKPFATTREEAEQIAAVSAETGVPIVVGAMHAYDAGWIAAAGSGVTPRMIRSSIVLPPNARFEDEATEILSRPALPPLNTSEPQARAAFISGAVMGLAIHDLPLIREWLGRVSPTAWRSARVISAELLPPFGYHIVVLAGGVLIELHAVMGSSAEPDWRLSAVGTGRGGEELIVDVHFTPSYVHAGSGTTVVTRVGGAVVVPPTISNGYESEWRHLAAIARGAMPLRPLPGLVDDLAFAASIAEGAFEQAVGVVEAVASR